ncbi:alpha/beta fold hydrolase [Chitinophaga japonensis]|uniref:Alpha/beta hydrolase family protein n=1 Tax=Chitinophaga japonensis TaxID=104662 RepID=A0A562T507_CHIJA|nr:alpha/beta hydrolase [Chitinophaga japonensis]TWI88615.1 alpha/beta hydrolase family protein [Chitinophaga japonensis]
MQQQVLPFSLRMSAFALSRLGRPFPGLTARVIYSMYSTPPKRKLRSTQLAVRDTALVEKASVSRYPFDERPLRLMLYRWGSSGKKVLLLHGWGGSPFDFKQMIHALVAAGYEVITFDAPAHGASQGKQTNLVQWMHVLEQLLERSGEVHGVIGHSMGGLNAALTLVHKPVQVPRLVMVSAAVSAPVVFNETFQMFRIPPQVMPRLRQLISERLQSDLLQLDLFRHIDRIKAGRILVAYDENDHLVKQEQIDTFLQQYPSIQSLKIKGEGHFRIMRNEAVISRVLAFLEQ